MLVHNFSGGSTVVESVAIAACGFFRGVTLALLLLPAFVGSVRVVESGVGVSGLDTTGGKVRAKDDDDGVEAAADPCV